MTEIESSSLISHMGAPSPLVNLLGEVRKQLHFNYYWEKSP